MKQDMIKSLVKARALRQRQTDLERIKSLLESTKRISEFIKSLEINENSSTVVFRELYESIRQLGEARWRLLGYEPLNHEICLDGLADLDIKEKTMLNHLPRFKKIRHDANYKGVLVSVSQASEIMEFWKKCCEEIIEILNKQVFGK